MRSFSLLIIVITGIRLIAIVLFAHFDKQNKAISSTLHAPTHTGRKDRLSCLEMHGALDALKCTLPDNLNIFWKDARPFL